MTNKQINRRVLRIQGELRALEEAVEEEVERLRWKAEEIGEHNATVKELQERADTLEQFDNDYLNYDLEDNLLEVEK